ncbi:MAG TPA: erythromycin esterase family protein [Acidimicrobiales bacterium]|jgi:erythromycin esterase-like protein
MRSDDAAVDEVRALARPLDGPADLDPLLDRVGDARYVLLGEASHGTSEYYRWRAELTRRLIEERGFSFVAVEGDWPDCFRVNRWVKGRAERDRSARDVLGAFERWPRWMWANEEAAELVAWLRDHNAATGRSVGFYGLDVYSLWDSMRSVLDYLDRNQPDAAEAARAAFRCFDPYGEDPQRYAWATRMLPASCEDAVIDVLVEVRRRSGAVDGEPEAELDAVQNAEVLAGAERYYRTMVRADGESWNVRDCHMVDTLDRLVAFHGPGAKAVVWEHNTHVGDARATDMARHGMVNVGQLVRERHAGEGVVLVGFGSHRGTVIAADRWGSPARRMDVPPAPGGTHEDVLHAAAPPRSLLVFGEDRSGPWLGRSRGHRAIGVVYRPGADRYGNWVPTVMGARYDAFCWFDETEALHPLHAEPAVHGAEMETAPWNS